MFLRDDLKLELSREKTLITHARTGAATFLGYEITVQHADHRRSINGAVGLRVPFDVIKAKCAPYLTLGKPEARTLLVNEDDHAIVETYGAQYRGLDIGRRSDHRTRIRLRGCCPWTCDCDAPIGPLTAVVDHR